MTQSKSLLISCVKLVLSLSKTRQKPMGLYTAVLSEGSISHMVQYMIGVLMQVRKTSMRIILSFLKVSVW